MWPGKSGEAINSDKGHFLSSPLSKKGNFQPQTSLLNTTHDISSCLVILVSSLQNNINDASQYSVRVKVVENQIASYLLLPLEQQIKLMKLLAELVYILASNNGLNNINTCLTVLTLSWLFVATKSEWSTYEFMIISWAFQLENTDVYGYQISHCASFSVTQ